MGVEWVERNLVAKFSSSAKNCEPVLSSFSDPMYRIVLVRLCHKNSPILFIFLDCILQVKSVTRGFFKITKFWRHYCNRSVLSSVAGINKTVKICDFLLYFKILRVSAHRTSITHGDISGGSKELILGLKVPHSGRVSHVNCWYRWL